MLVKLATVALLGNTNFIFFIARTPSKSAPGVTKLDKEKALTYWRFDLKCQSLDLKFSYYALIPFFEYIMAHKPAICEF